MDSTNLLKCSNVRTRGYLKYMGMTWGSTKGIQWDRGALEAI